MRGIFKSVAAFCLGTTALTLPVLAATYNVGGGTITTAQADSFTDNTGTNGGIILKPNTTGDGDSIVTSGVTINATTANLGADFGDSSGTTGSYTAAFHGTSISGVRTGLELATINGGISLDSTGGAANSFSGSDVGLSVAEFSSGGNPGSFAMTVKTGPDTISGAGSALRLSNRGDISLDSLGTTITASGTPAQTFSFYSGVFASSSAGNINIGQNSGFTATVSALSGIGIYAEATNGTENITLGSAAQISAQMGIALAGGAATIDSFGTITGSNVAIGPYSSGTASLTVTLESSSVTSGKVLGNAGADTFNVVAGADISNATLNGGGGADTLNLQGSSNGTLSLSSLTSIPTLNKSGTGTWTLTGSTSALQSIVVNDGGLTLGAGASFSGSPSLFIHRGTFDLNGNTVTIGTLNADGINTANMLAINGGTLTVNQTANGSFFGKITGTGNLIFNGPAALSFSGCCDNFSGNITVNAGKLIATGGVGGGDLTINGGTFTFDRTMTLTFGTLSGTGGTLDMGGSGLTFTSNVDSTFAGSIISTSGLFTKAGTGTLTLTGVSNNSFTPIEIDAGTLQFGNGGTGGGWQYNGMTNNGQFVINRSDDATFTGAISGTGSVIKLSPDKVTFAGNNTYTGSTTISGGTLEIFQSFPGNILDNSVLILDGSTYGGAISGTGSLQINNSGGTIVLTGTDSYSGGTTITVGTLQLGNGGTTGSIVGNVADSGTLAFKRSDTVTFSGVVSGIGALSQIGSGTLILTGANTYTGGTTVSSGTLQLGTGGSLASTGALTVNGGTFDLNGHTQTVGALSGTGGAITLGSGALTTSSSSSTTLGAVISGTGSFTKAGTGTLILTGANTYSGGTTISGGTLQIGSGGTAGAITGNVADNGTLAFSRSDTVTFPGVISGTGSLTQAGSGTLTLTADNSYSGGTTISSGTLVVGNGATSGLIAGNVTDNGALTFNRSDNITFSNVISGSGSFTKAAGGTLTLTGANSYTGGTTISAGTLQIGSGGTVGAIAGNVTNNAALIFNRSDAVSFGGVISGTGMVTQAGSGTLTLSAANTYTGATSVNAGTLNVTGAIASSSASVANGATLTGTGTVGSTSIASGATLLPGASGTPGTLTVNGSLTLASGANFVDFVTPSAASLATASGTASLNGTAFANFASGTYTVGQRFTLINATSGLSGSFAALNALGTPIGFKARLSYDANHAYLNLDADALAPLTGNTTGNQSNVLGAIDKAVQGGTAPTGGFTALYNLSGPSLNSAIDQISGQIGPNIANGAGQGSLSFFSLTMQGGDGGGSFAPGSAYGAAGAPHRAQLGSHEMRVWGAGYGGHVGLSADAVSGAAGLSGTNAGVVGGIDMRVADSLLIGATLGWGNQDFHSGNGTGSSDDVTIGLYARHDAGPLYVAAALGYGWHQVTTLRTVTVSGTDVLQGKQDAHDIGGRIEAGYRLSLDEAYGITPYAAFMGDSLESPAYAETAVSGASTFALSYVGHTTTLGRTKLGAGLARDYALADGMLSANLRAAWAHQIDDVPLTQASFLGLAGATFVVAGVHPARDGALLGASLEMHQRSGLFFGLKGESQLGPGTTIVEGMGTLGWHW